MSKLFKSLMRHSNGQEVTWVEEWEKASRAKSELFAIIDGVPSVQNVLRNMLESELKRLRKSVDIDKVYVNTDPVLPVTDNRPSGTLWEVVLYCLDNNVTPAYVLGGDGVFFLPDTLSGEFKVNVLNTQNVEDLISALAEGLEKALRSATGKFWAASVQPARPDSKPVSNKQAFIEAYALVTSAELSLSVMANNFDVGLGERFAWLLDSDTGNGAFEVNLQPAQDYLQALQPCFVLDNSERPEAEMPLLGESTGYLLHTPENSFEYFEKNTELHKQLQARLSLGSSNIRYPKASQSPHRFCAEAHILGQLESVSALLNGREQLETPLTSALQENQEMHVLRYSVNTRFFLLWRALKRTEWPSWLVAASSDVQERYTELEDSKDQYQNDYAPVFDACFSFKDYVLRTFAGWAARVLGEQLDPETISVHSSYSLRIAGRTVEQEDTRTLTEFLVFGLHDNDHRATLTITGAPSTSRFTAEALEQWLAHRNLRLEYAEDLASTPSVEYQEAYRNYLFSQMEFAAFVARHSGRLDSTDADIIARLMANDSTVTVRGLKIRLHGPALKDVLMIFAAGRVPSLLFIKTPAGEFELHKFSDIFAANRWLETAMSANREYAALLIHPDYLHDAGDLRGNVLSQLEYRYTLDARPVDLQLKPETPLADYVNVAYGAEMALHKAIAPAGYRALGFEGRKRYARLTTELKALSTVDARDNGFPTFEQFTYDAVKAQIEDILRARGSDVSVDPDRIFVQTEEFRKSVTDVLIEGVSFEATHPAYETKFSPKYYLVNGHPDIGKLDIRDLSSLSKTFRPGDRYSAMLKEQYLDKSHVDYAFKRAVHARKIRCEMSCNALSEFVNGRLSSEALSAVQRVIDSLKESGGYQSIVNNTHEGDEGLYKFNCLVGWTAAADRTIGGVYIFRLRLQSGFHDLLYTPDAPDLVSFRPIAEFIPSIRFRYGPFRDYYSGRILLVDKKVVEDYFDDLVATVDSKPVIRTQNRAKLPDLFTFQEERVRRVLSDIDERTISLNEIIAGLVYDNLLKAANIVSLLVPPVGTVVVAVQMMKSIYDASQSHRRGDYSAALGHVGDVLTGLVTLGKAAAAGAPAKELTRTQRSFLSLFGDARTVAELVTYYTGHQDPQNELIGFFKSLMEDADSALSKTTVR
ncbi:dermonecrotic toxin domain-containing protein [Pseudomonas triticicola]|uniref:dermonecrotic toxin domain-containing protein n=1 Tax=Pseudomonas triticicola TaxID=2842345 RepID=UPI003EBAA344